MPSGSIIMEMEMQGAEEVVKELESLQIDQGWSFSMVSGIDGETCSLKSIDYLSVEI